MNLSRSGALSFSTPLRIKTVVYLTMEEEANWLAGALLISEEAAIEIAKLNISVPEAAERYGGSKQMINFRLSVTGVRKRASFIRAR